MGLLIEAMKRPASQAGFVRPLGETRIHWSKLRVRPWIRNPKQHADRRHDDARMAYRHHGLIAELGRELLAHQPNSLVERRPTVTARGEQTLGFCFHVERAIPLGVFGPREAICFSRMDLAEITALANSLQAERKGE